LIGLFFVTFGRSIKLAGRGIGWVLEAVLGPPFDWLGERLDRRSAASRLRAKERRDAWEAMMMERAREDVLGWEICMLLGLTTQGPRPQKPNTPSKVATAIARFADGVVAFWQAHPRIGLRTDAVASFVGRALVRWVFYPLCVLVPVATFAWVGLQIDHHYHGLIGAVHAVWSNPVNWLHVAWSSIANGVHLAWTHVLVYMAASIGAGLALMFLMIGTLWMCLKLDDWSVGSAKHHWTDIGASDYHPPSLDLRSDPIASGTTFSFRVKDMLSRRATPILSKVAQPLKVGMTGMGRGIGAVGKGTGHRALAVGHGTKSTAKFFVVGHHAIKDRTCPRIRIVDNEEVA
jgi:hypothetical protein